MGGITVDGELAYPATSNPHMCGSWYLPRFLFRGVFNPGKHFSLYGPGDALRLPTHYVGTVQFDGMTCGVGMVINGGGGPMMFLVSSPNGPTSFADVLHCTSHMVTLKPVDNTSFVIDFILALGATNRSLIVLLPLKWTWTPALPHTFF